MSSSSNLVAMKKIVQQLRFEASINRVKVRPERVRRSTLDPARHRPVTVRRAAAEGRRRAWDAEGGGAPLRV